MDDTAMSMWILHGNAFTVQSFQLERRGENRLSFPNMSAFPVGCEA